MAARFVNLRSYIWTQGFGMQKPETCLYVCPHWLFIGSVIGNWMCVAKGGVTVTPLLYVFMRYFFFFGGGVKIADVFTHFLNVTDNAAFIAFSRIFPRCIQCSLLAFPIIPSRWNYATSFGKCRSSIHEHNRAACVYEWRSSLSGWGIWGQPRLRDSLFFSPLSAF